MRDKVSIQRVADLHPAIRDEVKALIEKAEEGLPSNIAIRVVEAYRSVEYQDGLYAQGRTKPGKIVTKAKGGLSYHNYGLALDFAFVIDRDKNGTFEFLSWNVRDDFDKDGISDWREVVNIFREAGYIWGADWDNDGKTKEEGDKDEHLVDYPHLQKIFGLTVHQLHAMYLSNRFLSNSHFVSI